MTSVDVRVRFTWSTPCPVTLDDCERLAVGDLPAVPGIYRWTLSGAGRARPGVYVGEGGDLRARIRNYRRPSRLPTAGRLHVVFADHLRDGGTITLETATAARVDPASTDAPLARRTLRRFVEGAAIAAELADGSTELLNRDSGE